MCHDAQNRRKGQIQPAKPRVLLYNRTDTLEPMDNQDCSLIAAKKVGGKFGITVNSSILLWYLIYSSQN